ncbi:MAG: membrane protein insertase YidC [Candidatus Cloacimonadota bacterium]|nr:membrane protein insertase YidC [Candidatus Cloacimonadota bacterium]
MDKKTLFALLLILAVFWISSKFIWKPATNTTKAPAQTSEKITPKSEPKQETEFEQSATLETSTTEPEKDIPVNNNIVLENDVMKVSFTNRGAVLNSVILKNYKQADGENLVNLIPENKNAFNVEILSGSSFNLENEIFEYRIDNNEIIFYKQTPQGHFEKRFYLVENYHMNMEFMVESPQEITSYNIWIDSGIADTEKYLKMKSRDYRIVSKINNDIEKFTLSKLNEIRTERGNIDWAAVRSKYFALGIIPDELVRVKELEAYQTAESPALKLTALINRNKFQHNYQIYLGPLINKYLIPFDNDFEKIQEGQGFLKPISSIFVWFMNKMNKVIPNNGINIIILALILKFILYPLTHKSFESTSKMQKVQPLMREIQTKYKNDPKKMNLELRKLYKEEGVSPLGGCLPLLLQMPIFFALYPVLRYSITLRQSEFLWLQDLSEPDKTLILPIIMAVFMFTQQKLMQPKKKDNENIDEKQQAQQQSQKMMMYVMPIIMFFIFKGLPAGLVLYWTVFNIMSIFQQYFIKKKFN